MTDIENSGTLQKRVVSSVVAQIISQILMGLLGVIILKIMTNNLGKSTYGVYVTIIVFVSTFALLTDLGLNSITSREVAKDPANAAEIIGHNLGLRIALSLVMIPTIFGLSYVFYPHANNQLRYGILLMSAFLFFDVIWAASSSYFTAKVRGDISAKFTITQQILFLIAVVGVTVAGFGLFGFIAAYVITVAIGALLILYKVRTYIPVYPRIHIKSWRKIIKASIALGLISIINAMYLKADSVMISVLKGTAEVGVYGVAYLLVNIFSSLPGYIMGALTPAMARAKPEELQQIIQKAFHYMSVFAFVVFVGSFLARRNVVLVISSQQFIAAATPFAILTIGIAFSYISSVFSFASVAINKHHKFLYVSLTTLLLNIGINFVLIPRYGIVGAAWATVMSEFLSMLIIYRLFRKITKVNINPKVALKPSVTAVVTFAVSSVAFSHLETHSAFLNCLLVLLLVAVPYFAILYVIKGLPKEMQSIIAQSLSRLRSTHIC